MGCIGFFPRLTGIYWVLLGLTVFYWDFVGFTALHLVSLGFTVFTRFILGFSEIYSHLLIWLVFKGFYWVLLGIKRVSPRFTWMYWILIGFYWVYWVLLGFPLGRTWFLLDFTEFNCVLLGLTRLLPSLRCHSPPTEANLGILPTFYCVSLIILSFEPCGIRTSSGDLRGTFTTEDRSLVSFFSISRKRRDTHTHTHTRCRKSKKRKRSSSVFFFSLYRVCFIVGRPSSLNCWSSVKVWTFGWGWGGRGQFASSRPSTRLLAAQKKRSHRKTRRLKWAKTKWRPFSLLSF